MNKIKLIKKYSNFNKVFFKAKKIFGNKVKIKISTRKDKKYMIFLNNKWIHFGQMGYEDFTKHKDKNRRKWFLNRNKKWRNQKKNTPGFLSYYLLW